MKIYYTKFKCFVALAQYKVFIPNPPHNSTHNQMGDERYFIPKVGMLYCCMMQTIEEWEWKTPTVVRFTLVTIYSRKPPVITNIQWKFDVDTGWWIHSDANGILIDIITLNPDGRFFFLFSLYCFCFHGRRLGELFFDLFFISLLFLFKNVVCCEQYESAI